MDKELWRLYTAGLDSVMTKDKYALCRKVEIILLSEINKPGVGWGEGAEAALLESRKGTHREGQMWVTGNKIQSKWLRCLYVSDTRKHATL